MPPIVDALTHLWLALAQVHLPYARYLCRHKVAVYRAGRRRGVEVPRWRLLIHDWSKFLPSEWHAYAWYFYGGTVTHDRQRAFNRAWLRHQQRQDHHWQSHLLREDSGLTIALPMSDVQRREMLADWRGAGAALGKPDTAAWYRKNAGVIELYFETRDWVERQLFDGLTMAEHDVYAAARAAWLHLAGSR